MKRFILGSVVALTVISEPATATCLYLGFPYSEGARICMYRTMFMCRGERWVKTAERCWASQGSQANTLSYRKRDAKKVLSRVCEMRTELPPG